MNVAIFPGQGAQFVGMGKELYDQYPIAQERVNSANNQFGFSITDIMFDGQEIDNAIANALREITNRYDFKGSNTTLERSEHVITIVTDDDLKLSQVNDILISHFVRRKLDPLALGKKDKEKAGGDRIRQTISLVEGIEQDIAKKITSEIKSSKMKVQAKINGNELRIDGKKRDDLQSAMQLIEDLQVGIPVQFINFRD